MWESLPNTPEFREFMQAPMFLKLPALLPPLGVVPNYENPKNFKAPELSYLHDHTSSVLDVLRQDVCCQEDVDRRL